MGHAEGKATQTNPALYCVRSFLCNTICTNSVGPLLFSYECMHAVTPCLSATRICRSPIAWNALQNQLAIASTGEIQPAG
jgi:hypothetical protein